MEESSAAPHLMTFTISLSSVLFLPSGKREANKAKSKIDSEFTQRYERWMLLQRDKWKRERVGIFW